MKVQRVPLPELTVHLKIKKIRGMRAFEVKEKKSILQAAITIAAPFVQRYKICFSIFNEIPAFRLLCRKKTRTFAEQQ